MIYYRKDTIYIWKYNFVLEISKLSMLIFFFASNFITQSLSIREKYSQYSPNAIRFKRWNSSSSSMSRVIPTRSKYP